ncbi:MAG: c-type cytochrome [Deltaproteobacteria bacterium]|nr:c-type cytochrome [Deltaproteobacteria bacterium]
MASLFYNLLRNIGYNHPLHPALTHLPVGLTIAGFIFIALSIFLKRPNYAQSAKHCVVLALLAAIPTVIVGYLDWQHFYGGSFLFPIKMKLGLAIVLVVLLLAAVFTSIRSEKGTLLRLLVHLLSLLVVTGIGYFGGELVYGKKITTIKTTNRADSNNDSVVAGAKLFENSCSFCHLTDSTDTKVGPGLKGLFEREKMPVSGWPVSADSLRRQLNTPFNQMPPFDQLDNEEINALTDFLKSL